MTASPNRPQTDESASDGGSTVQNPAGPENAQGSQQPIVIELSGGALSRQIGWSLAWIGWGLLLIAAIAIGVLWSGRSEYYDTTKGISEAFFSGDQFARDKVAIITISGVIYDGAGFVKHQIDRIRDDKNVKAVVVRVDSPGGTVAGSDYIFHHLKKLRKERDFPIVVSMGSIAASGGYYVAMAVGDESSSIFAEPTTTTGSIGVIIPHYDVSGLLEQFHIDDDSIASHPRKQMLSMTKPIPDDERELLQSHVDELFELFKDRVQEGRPFFQKNKDKLDALATGEIFTAGKAKQLGLVDQIGFIEDAIERAIELAGLDDEKVRVVRFNRPASLIEIPLLTQTPGGPSGLGVVSPQLAALLELSTPRAYYLASSLPPLLSSREDR